MDSQNYIIQLNGDKFIINNLLRDDKFYESKTEYYIEYDNGFMYNFNNACLNSGYIYIHILDLNSKKIFKQFNTKCDIYNIIEWIINLL